MVNLPPSRRRYTAVFVLFVLFCLLLESLPVLTREALVLDEQTLIRAQQRFGPGARKRLLAWMDLVNGDQSQSEREKLDKVNRFFNRLDFIDDIIHWKKKDYWATPVEFLASDGGDCEDFAIAKYFTLKLMGVDENKLTLTYVKALGPNQAHMVLTYYPRPGAEPLILDSLIDAIEPASRRTDLLPVYSFNASGLWLAKQRGRGRQVGSSERLKRWQDLLARLPESLN